MNKNEENLNTKRPEGCLQNQRFVGSCKSCKSWKIKYAQSIPLANILVNWRVSYKGRHVNHKQIISDDDEMIWDRWEKKPFFFFSFFFTTSIIQTEKNRLKKYSSCHLNIMLPDMLRRTHHTSLTLLTVARSWDRN